MTTTTDETDAPTGEEPFEEPWTGGADAELDDIDEYLEEARRRRVGRDFRMFFRVDNDLEDAAPYEVLQITVDELLEMVQASHLRFIAQLTDDLSVDEFLIEPIATFAMQLGLDEYAEQISDLGWIFSRLAKLK